MKRSHGELQAGTPASASQKINSLSGEASNPPLNLRLTKTPELISLIESALKQQYPCPHKQKSPISTPPEAPKCTKIPKALNFPISKITIGEWSRVKKHAEDLKAKFYFARKKLMWEILETDTLKRKIEIPWHHVLSLKTTIQPNIEILEVELSKRPTFFQEIDQQVGKHTQWKQMDLDFTTKQSASICRIHELHFAPGVLQNNLDKLKSGDSFWSKLLKVPFPTLQSSFFDYRIGNNFHNDSNAAQCSHDRMVSFNVNSGLLYNQSQGFDHVGVGEGNINMATQIGAYDEKQIYTAQAIIQNNLTNQLFGMQAIQPSSQPINEHYHPGGYFPGSEFNNPMIQDLSQTRNTWESSLGSQTRNTWESSHGSQTRNKWESSLGSQAYPEPLREIQTNSTYRTSSILLQADEDMTEVSIYPQVGSFVGDILFQAEEKRQNMPHTHLNGDVQINGHQQIDNNPNQPIGFNHSYNQQTNSKKFAGDNYGYGYGNNNGFTAS